MTASTRSRRTWDIARSCPTGVYLSGEVEGAVYSNAVQGFFEGTYTGDTNPIPSEHVFPGAWKVDKNHSFGFNARLGYVARGPGLPGRRPFGVPDFRGEVAGRDL